MFKTEEQIRKMATLTGVLLMAAAEALAQEKQQPARRIVVSIPDRKLAVMEAGRVLRVFPTAVGAPNNPASIGHNASHGCIRMRNHDVEQLFEMVSVGDTVELYDQATPETGQIFAVAAAGTL
jgi:hypothetical protein